jgi:hypothetical protein
MDKFVRIMLAAVVGGFQSLAYANVIATGTVGFDRFSDGMGTNNSITFEDFPLPPPLVGRGTQVIVSSAPTPGIKVTTDAEGGGLISPEIPNFTRSFASGTLAYNFYVKGPSPTAEVPVMVSGFFGASGGVFPDANGTPTGPSFAEFDIHVDVFTELDRLSLNPRCVTTFGNCPILLTNFTGAVRIHSGFTGQVSLSASSQSNAFAGDRVLGTAMVDPYLFIDPNWSAENPGYSLTVDPLVGNAPPIPAVPEPSGYWLLLTGLGAVLANRASEGRRAEKRSAQGGQCDSAECRVYQTA